MAYQFKAALVTSNKSIALIICMAGILLFVCSIAGLMVRSPNITMFCLLGGIITLVIGVIVGKGNVSAYTIQKDQFFIFTEEYIQIGLVIYPLKEISDLVLRYHSYNNQSPGGYYTEHSGKVLYGIDNHVAFTYREMYISTDFFLPNKKYADAFFEMMEYFKREGIKFRLNVNYLYR